MTIKKQLKHIASLNDLTKQLKSNDEKQKFDETIKSIDKKITEFIKRIQIDDKITKNEIDKQINEINNFINNHVTLLRNKLAEQERLAKIQQQMEEERKRNELEERKKKEEEEIKRRKAEIEERRRLDAATLAELEAKEKSQQQPLNNQRTIEEEAEIKRLEQERQDYELAKLLAEESSSSVSENWNSSPTLSPRSTLNENKLQKDKKYDLTNWKYSDLRDTINTSCDLELLEACREEFHRRLKVYHAWKTRANKSKNGPTEERAPSSIMQYHDINGFNSINKYQNGVNEQRYFRIPFVRPSAPSGQKGWWFAHFDGQWIARQLEIHPEKQPILLVAGLFINKLLL